jgi:hypothetical protein
MKKIKVKQYTVPTKFGDFSAKKVEVLVYDEKITQSNFDVRKHEHAISTEAALAAERQAGEQFLGNNYKSIRVGSKVLNSAELAGIMLVCDLRAVQFAKLLGVSKGQMSKLLKSSKIPKTVSIAAIDLLLNEIRLAGYSKVLLGEKALKKSPKERRSDDKFVRKLLSDSAA